MQYVICLLPLLVQKKEYHRTYTMLDRTAYYFKCYLYGVKRIAFMTSLLIHCQYDVHVEVENILLQKFTFDIWDELFSSINLAIANNRTKLCFFFGGIFMVDVFKGQRINKYLES